MQHIPWDFKSKQWAPLTGQKHLLEKAITEIKMLRSTARLAAGIGFNELMPDAITWVQQILKGKELNDDNTFFYVQKMVVNVFYERKTRNEVRSNKTLRDSFIDILDVLINHSSATAFLIREDFISGG